MTDNNISMGELRSNPGTVVDMVFYQKRSFVLNRGGKPKAALVPLRDYLQFQQNRAKAKKRLFAMEQEIKKQTKGVDPQEAEAIIQEAIDAVRAEERNKREKSSTQTS